MKLILTKKLSSLWTIISFVNLVQRKMFYFSVTTLKEFAITTKHKFNSKNKSNSHAERYIP